LVPAQAGDGDGTERGRARGRLWVCSLDRSGTHRNLAGTCAGRRGREAKPARSRISRSRRWPLPGGFDPARPRGNVDRDETGPQSPSLETNGFAERSGLAETQTHTLTVIRAWPGPLRASPPTRQRKPEVEKPCPPLPPQSLRDSSPRGEHLRGADPPPLGEVARRAGGGKRRPYRPRNQKGRPVRTGRPQCFTCDNPS
jgi:hypothetical protein